MNASNRHNTISAAIVGLGNIGLYYDLECPGETVMTHTVACLRHPQVSLVAGVDPEQTARRTFERIAQSPAYADLTGAGLHQGQADLLIVATPTAVRRPVVEQCVALRPQAILLEKPLADNLEEGRAIVELCRDRGIRLAVNYFRRFDESIARIGREIRSGRFGALRHGSCLYSGGLLNNASHYVDLILDWFGTPDSAGVAGLGLRREDSPALSENESEDDVRAKPPSGTGIVPPNREQSVADSPGMFSLDYPSAQVVFREIDADYGIGELDLLFERGRVRFENYCEDLTVMTPEPDSLFPSYRRLVCASDRGNSPDLLRYQYNVLDRVIAGIRDGVDIPSTGETALAVLETCLKVMPPTHPNIAA